MKLVNKIKDRLAYEYYVRLAYKKSWKTNRKIVVIESDDWGSIRMPNKEVYNKLLKSGIRVDKCGYCSNDTLADKNDFEAIFETLLSIKNSKGESPKITANTIVANPDFEKIRNADYQEYHFETIEHTFERYPNRSLKFWKDGINENIFKPQLHGREHLNIDRWLLALQNNSKEMRLAFDNEMFGISSTISNETKISYLQALQINDESIKNHINEATKIFNELFGFNSDTFIAPNYCWNDTVEHSLAENKIYGIQGGLTQNKDGKKVYHYLGEHNKLGQTYLSRNILFEPTLHKRVDIVNKTFVNIKEKFDSNMPAIICSHRLNFIGAINENNRSENLIMLKTLLNKVTVEFPEVEFMFSDELYKLISKK